MSTENTSFGVGSVRDVQPGDTPDLNDGLLSRPVTQSTDILRGQACIIDTDGFVKVATVANYTTNTPAAVPFVPIEDISTASGEELPISGVGAPQRVAVEINIPVGVDSTNFETIFPGSYLQVSAVSGILELWDGLTSRYGRFLGIEAALLDRETVDPFSETLTPGIVPDVSVDGEVSTGDIKTFTGWIQMMENIKV